MLLLSSEADVVSGNDVVDAMADDGSEESRDCAKLDKGSVTFSGDCERIEVLIQSGVLLLLYDLAILWGLSLLLLYDLF